MKTICNNVTKTETVYLQRFSSKTYILFNNSCNTCCVLTVDSNKSFIFHFLSLLTVTSFLFDLGPGSVTFDS